MLLPASIGRSAISHCADRFGKGSFLEVRTGGSGDPQYNTDTSYKKTLGKSVADTTLIYSNMVRLPGHVAHPLPLWRWVVPCGGSRLLLTNLFGIVRQRTSTKRFPDTSEGR